MDVEKAITKVTLKAGGRVWIKGHVFTKPFPAFIIAEIRANKTGMAKTLELFESSGYVPADANLKPSPAEPDGPTSDEKKEIDQSLLDNDISNCVKEAVESHGLTVDEANHVVHAMIGVVGRSNIVIADLRAAFISAAEEKAVTHTTEAEEKAAEEKSTKDPAPPEKPKTGGSEKQKPIKPPVRKRKK